MPYEYFSDEEYLKQWLSVEKDPEEFKKFFKKQILDTKNFYEYLDTQRRHREDDEAARH